MGVGGILNEPISCSLIKDSESKYPIDSLILSFIKGSSAINDLRPRNRKPPASQAIPSFITCLCGSSLITEKPTQFLKSLDICKQTSNTFRSLEEPFSGILIKIFDCRAVSPFGTVPGSLIRSVEFQFPQPSDIVVCTSSENSSSGKTNQFLEPLYIS